jgi:hypothetical protein
MSDIDVKLKPVSYRLPRITDPLSHTLYHIPFTTSHFSMRQILGVIRPSFNRRSCHS